MTGSVHFPIDNHSSGFGGLVEYLGRVEDTCGLKAIAKPRKMLLARVI